MTKVLNFKWKNNLCRPDSILALALTALIVCLHVYFLCHAGGFSRDEVNLINLSHCQSFAEMEKDSFPVLMPVAVRIWSALGLGGNDFGLRILGALIGLGTPAGLWLAAWKIRRSPPLLGLSLLALNSTFITYGDSLRAYGLGSLAILLAAAAAGLFLINPTRTRAAILALLAMVSVQALYQNAVLVAAICLGAWAVCAKEKNAAAALKILLVAAVSAASLLPYWPHVAALPDAARGLRGGFDLQMLRVSLDNALGFPFEQYIWLWASFVLLTAACAVAALCRRKQNIQMQSSPTVKWTALTSALAAAFGFIWFIVSPETRWPFLPALALAILYLDSGRWQKRPSPPPAATACPQSAPQKLSLFAGVTLLAGLAAFYGFLRYAALPVELWYFLPLMALAAACFEIALPRSLHARAAIFGFAAVTTLFALPPLRNNLDWRFTDIDVIAQRLATAAQPDDFIIVSPWYDGITFGHYFNGAAPWNTLPPLNDHSVHRYDLVREQMQTTAAIQPVLEKISVALQSSHHLWVVARMELPQPGPMPAALPPPPLKYTGWADRPYDLAWQNQMAQFLANHCRDFDVVYQPTNLNVNDTESLKLYEAAGWRGAALPANSK